MKFRLSYLTWFLPICLLLMGQSCQNEPPVIEEPMVEEPETPEPGPSISFLALGDSYTIGQSVEFSQRWPMHLYDFLQDQSVPVDTPRFIARTGWTTDELQVAMAGTSWLKDTFDLVSLLIGVNNQFRGYDFAQYEREFLELLLEAVRLAQGQKDRVFVVSIPDYGVTPFGQSRNPQQIATELDQYNAYAFRKADSMGIAFYNITDISREAPNDTTLLASDQLHPSGSMYERWVKEVIGTGVQAQLTP